MKKVNYHTHTDYCGHAVGKAADYVQEALDQGLEVLGFSEHIPYEQDQFAYRMPLEQLANYQEDVQALINQYRGRLQILCGFEGEYLRGWERWYESLLTSDTCDYMILGQHMYVGRDGGIVTSGDLQSTEEYLDYVDSLIAGMKTGYFKMIAHPDFMFVNHFAWDIHCDRACDRLMNAAIADGYVLEYNANGYRRGLCEFDDGIRYQYPHALFWQKVAEAGIPVMISSDCHEPAQMYDDFVKKAYEDAAALSLHVITDLFFS